jgi:predicted transcriptional regulator of viral defense system
MNARPSNQITYEAVYTVAETQAGYFTAAQAKSVGLSQRQLHYYVRTGRFTRVKTGLYRLALFPPSAHEDLFAARLEIGPQAVISHESALTLYELSDVLPSEMHMIVPPTTSRRHKRVRLHNTRLSPDEVDHIAGLPVTTVARTIADVAASGLADELVVQAFQQAVQQGLASAASLLAYAQQRGGRTLKLAGQALREATHEVSERGSFS